MYYPATDIKYGPADPAKMCGNGQMEELPHAPEEPQLRAAYVRFENGAYTKWHYHTGTQLLVGVEGVGFVEIQGLPRFPLRERDRVFVPAGVWHRHGAEAGQTMIHLAVTTGFTEWDQKDPCGIQR